MPATPSTSHAGFTQIWNALIVDHRLGATAYRVASYLGSKTSDWTIREKHICETLGIGHAAYLTAMRELVGAGYVVRGKTTRDALGRLRSEPSTLARRLIVADPGRAQPGPESGSRTSVAHTSDGRTSYSTLSDSTLSTQQEEDLREERPMREDQGQSGATEGARSATEGAIERAAPEVPKVPESWCHECDSFVPVPLGKLEHSETVHPRPKVPCANGCGVSFGGAVPSGHYAVCSKADAA